MMNNMNIDTIVNRGIWVITSLGIKYVRKSRIIFNNDAQYMLVKSSTKKMHNLIIPYDMYKTTWSTDRSDLE